MRAGRRCPGPRESAVACSAATVGPEYRIAFTPLQVRLEERQRAPPGELGVGFVVARAGRVGEGVFGLVPVAGGGLAGLGHV